MRREAWMVLTAVAGLWLAAAPARGQGSFLLTVTDGTEARLASNGQLVEFKSNLGVEKVVTVDVLYTGSYTADFGYANLTGTADFQFAGTPPVPSTLKAGQKLTFRIRFTPSVSTKTLAQLAITARELPPEGSNVLPGAYGLLYLGLVGTAPEVKVAYSLSTDANVWPVGDGGKVTFAPTTVDTQAYATIFVVNQGSALAPVESVSVEGGPELQLIELPLLPADLGAGQSLRFRVRYWPKGLGTQTATLTVRANGATTTVQVEASAQGPRWVYELIPEGEGAPAAMEPDTTVTLAETEIGKKTTAWVRVTNAGNYEGQIAGIGVLGQGFTLVDPPFTPLTVKTEKSVTFGVAFQPGTAGKATGRLRVGSDFFNLAATGVGAQLEYTYTAATANTAVQAGGLVVAPSTAVGQGTAALFTVQNTGNRAATIATVSLSGTGNSYRLENVPGLPLVLEPEQKASFTIRFQPERPGTNTDVLTVGSVFFTLTGSAASLPALPGYRFEGPSGTVAPLQQPLVGLTLAETYPVTLRGTLTMTIDADSFGADPAVQFATGGRVVSFTIPANTTKAVFANGGTGIRMQTGSAAGTIVLTPTFVTEGGIDRTPTTPTALTLNVPALAPAVVGVRMEVTGTGVQFVVTGYTTPRNLKKIDLTVKRSGGQEQAFSFDVTASAAVWFGSASSQGYGGLFSAVAPFTITGSVDDRNKLLQELTGATVTVTNDRGASQPLTVQLQP